MDGGRSDRPWPQTPVDLVCETMAGSRVERLPLSLIREMLRRTRYTWEAPTAASGDRPNAATPLASDVVWTPLLDDQPTLSVGSIAIQPGNSNVLLVGTGETNSATDSYYGLGILRSADGGVSWSLISSSIDGRAFKGMGFSKFAFSAENPSIVVAAAGFASRGVSSGLTRATTEASMSPPMQD